jgi:hypothetical protein
LGEFKKFCKANNILILPTKSKLKASVIERWNRTIKAKMWRLITHHTTKKLKFPKNVTKYLKQLVDSYNNSYHRSIRTSPNLVNKKNENNIRKVLYGENEDVVVFKYKAGDYVRISLEKELFSKGYLQGWEKDIYVISNLFPTTPPRYTIKDLNNSEYSHKFYTQQLQKINFEEFPFDTFKVLKVKGDKLLIEKVNSDNSVRSWTNKSSLLS